MGSFSKLTHVTSKALSTFVETKRALIKCIIFIVISFINITKVRGNFAKWERNFNVQKEGCKGGWGGFRGFYLFKKKGKAGSAGGGGWLSTI